MPNPASGRLTVITGPMFAGKTSELLRRIDRARRRGCRVAALTHAVDDRFGPGRISSHDGRSGTATAVDGVGSLLDAVLATDPPAQLMALDEAQFFPPELSGAVDKLLRRGVNVTVAGLCQTFDGGPFEPVATLLTQAEEVLKLTAVCQTCGADAAYHQLLDDSLNRSGPIIGGAELYEARCRAHFTG